MAEKNWIELSVAEIKRFTPASGFNVVGVDRLAKPGEALYLIKKVDSEAEANRLAAEHEKKSGNKTHVYPAKKTK